MSERMPARTLLPARTLMSARTLVGRPLPVAALLPPGQAPDRVPTGGVRSAPVPVQLLVGLARLVLAAVIGLMICAAVPVAAGWRSGVILTGSMSPALRVGDIVLSRPSPGHPPAPGRVIVVHDPVRPGETLVHRLVRIEPNGDLITKGDANAVPDSTPVTPRNLEGVVRFRIPMLGLAAVWTRNHQFGRLLLATLVCAGIGRLAAGGFEPRFRGTVAETSDERFRGTVLAQGLGRGRHVAGPVLGVLVFAGLLGAAGGGPAASLLGGFHATLSAFTADTHNDGNSFAARAAFPAYRHAVLADHPIAFYQSDDPAGSTTAVDTSGNNVTGDYRGATSRFQVPGSPAGGTGSGADTAVHFPGTGRATATSNATMNDPNTFTSEIWFRTTSTAGGRFLGLGDAATGDSFFTDRVLSMFGDGVVQFAAGSSSIRSAAGYNDGAWHLATASLGPAGMRLYLDGVLAASDPGTTAGQNYVGYWRVGGDNVYFDGDLDEAAIYLSQLSTARVAAHYAAGLAAVSPTDYTTVVNADSPWALWHLDDPAAASYPGGVYDTVMADASGQHHPGVYHDLPPLGLVAGGAGALVGTGAGGTSVHYLQSGTGFDPTSILGPSAFSEEAWFRSTATNGGELMGFGSSPEGGSNGHDRSVYLLNNGKLEFGIYSGGPVTITSPAAYNDGSWHYVVATDGPAGLALYVDGAQVATDVSPGATDAGAGFWRWGGDSLVGWPDRPGSDYFAGDLDEIAFYGAQLSPAQVAAHYAANH